jgi:hypothetical protein
VPGFAKTNFVASWLQRFFSWENQRKTMEKPGVEWDLLGFLDLNGAFHGILLGFNKISVF